MTDNKKIISSLAVALAAAGAIEGVKKLVNHYQKNIPQKADRISAQNWFTKLLIEIDKFDRIVITRMLGKMKSWQRDDFIFSVGNIAQSMTDEYGESKGLENSANLLNLFIEIGPEDDKDIERIKLAKDLNLIHDDDEIHSLKKLQADMNDNFEPFAKKARAWREKMQKKKRRIF